MFYTFYVEDLPHLCVRFALDRTMNRIIAVLFIGAFATLLSSCNIDEDLTTDAPEPLKVVEYAPAPGQFINDMVASGFDGTQTTPEKALEYAKGRLAKGLYVSLGGFGGYIVVAFDHNVVNYPQHDFDILCNAFDGSSEPGIVWVMQDENGDGKPNETWYELAGSETGKAETIQNYAVTYYRPSGAKEAVQWSDNLGNIGELVYLGGKHSGDSYYPQWIDSENYTLTGTCLKARNYDKLGDGSLWVNPSYDWGYADNQSPEDFSAKSKSNLFDISNAVDAEGKRVELEYINFVKVQCGVNAVSGYLGEISTEICGVRDIHAIEL